MAHDIGTVTVKMTDTELELAISSLEFYTTLNIPVENDYLIPYEELKQDLIRIQKKLEDYKHEVRHGKKETVVSGFTQQEECEPCD